MTLCETCRNRDADRHMISRTEQFAYCNREGFYVVPREHCGYYRRGAQ